MRAKYATTCPACPARVAPGDEIVKGPGGRWVHEACAPAALPGAPAVSPAPLAPAGTTAVYTDGSCLANPGGAGGWAWATGTDRHGVGSDPSTTNQRMEIRAAYEGVLANPGPLLVVSDSQYVVNCFEQAWWRGWHSRGWLNSAKKPVANRDLWEPFVELVVDRGDVGFQWVKGHAGHAMNELVDRLAGEAARSVAL